MNNFITQKQIIFIIAGSNGASRQILMEVFLKQIYSALSSNILDSMVK